MLRLISSPTGPARAPRMAVRLTVAVVAAWAALHLTPTPAAPRSARFRAGALRPVLQGSGRGRVRGDAGAADRGLRELLPERRPNRLRFAVVRPSHMEALQGRQRTRHLDIQLHTQPVGEDHR